MDEPLDIDTSAWTPDYIISIDDTAGNPSPVTLQLIVHLHDGFAPAIVATLSTDRDALSSIELLAKAWISGHVVFKALPYNDDVLADRRFFVAPADSWVLPHPKYSFAAAAFAYAVRTQTVPEREVQALRAVTVTVANVRRTRERDGLMWSCTVLVNGKRATQISNDGNGSEDTVTVFDQVAFDLGERHAAITVVDARRSDDDVPAYSFGLPALAARLCDEYDLKKRLKTKIIFKLPDKRTLERSGTYTLAARTDILAKFPGAVILNETIGGQVARDLTAEEADPAHYKRMCKTKTVFRPEPGTGLLTVPGRFTAIIKAQVLDKYPQAVFLNETLAGQTAQ